MKEGTTFNFWEQENNKKKLYIKKKWSNFLKEPDSKKKKKIQARCPYGLCPNYSTKPL